MFQDVKIFASDNFHPAADVQYRNLVWENLYPDTATTQLPANPDNPCSCSTGGHDYIFSKKIIILYWPIVLITGLVIGLSVSLAFFICGCIALAVLAAHLYRQLKNRDKEPIEDNKKESSIRYYYAENYYDSVE